MKLGMICEALRQGSCLDLEGVGYVIDGLKLIQENKSEFLKNEKTKEQMKYVFNQVNEYLNGEKANVFTRRELFIYLAQMPAQEEKIK